MTKKNINYELLLIESCLGDFSKQQKMIRDFNGSKLLTEEGQRFLDIIRKANADYEALDIDNFMSYATTMSSNTKENGKYIGLIGKLGESIIGANDFEKYLDIVKKQIKEDKLKKILEKVNIDLENGDVDNAVRKLDLEEIRENFGKGKEKTREEKLVDFMLDVDKNYGEGSNNGITFGIKPLDDAIGKLKRGELFVLGGSSGAGKSLACNNIFAKLILEGKNVIYFSLEMGTNNLLARTASIVQGVNPKFYRGTFESNEAIIQETELNEKFVAAMTRLNNWDVVSCADLPDSRATIENVLEKSLLIQKERKWSQIDCIIIDYLQFLDASQYGMTEYEKINNAVNKIKTFIVSEDVPLILITSLNANGEIKGSTNILYTSDFSATINNDGRNKEIKHLDIIKSRYGGTGEFKIKYDNKLRMQVIN